VNSFENLDAAWIAEIPTISSIEPSTENLLINETEKEGKQQNTGGHKKIRIDNLTMSGKMKSGSAVASTIKNTVRLKRLSGLLLIEDIDPKKATKRNRKLKQL
jgi:hypothetical protein